MTGFIADVQVKDIYHMAFGDLFLEDVRAYRERQLAGTGITPLFPLWGSDTTELAQAMIDAAVGVQPSWQPFVVLVVWTAAAALVAVRTFRWE